VDQFRSDSEYSIRQQNSYMGAYQIPASLSIANPPSSLSAELGRSCLIKSRYSDLIMIIKKMRTAGQRTSLGRVLDIQFGNSLVTWDHIKFLHHCYLQISHHSRFQVWARSCLIERILCLLMTTPISASIA
jgi:hypothetical protein